MKNILFGCSLTTLLLLTSLTPLERRDFRISKVVIDAGHGGKDSGAVGAISLEKHVALKIALELGRILQENLKDIKVIYTRSRDEFVELERRAQIANKAGADMFISIHCNAVPRNQDNIYGTETYVMGLHTSEANFEVAKRENSVLLLEDNYQEVYEGFDPKSPESYILFSLYQNAYLENSLRLAEKIEHQFQTRVGRKSRGVKQAGFLVLYRTSMPSVLVEVGYLSNKTEEKYLNDPLGQTYLASAIFRALRDYKNEIEQSTN